MKSAAGSKLAVITDSKKHTHTAFALIHFSDLDFGRLEKELLPFDGCVVDFKDGATSVEVLSHLRKSRDTFLMPLYLYDSLEPFADALADGIFADDDKIADHAEKILTRIGMLSYDLHSVLANPLFRVIVYYYTRETQIIPVKDWRSPSLYNYPLVELLTTISENADTWLETQVQRLFLEKGRLLDRVRCCPHCGLADPNYIDVCPHCRSIHIQKESFFHCFTCGTVQPEKNFHTSTGTLVCPQCQARLRHIGTDYDRPLENYTCADCQSSFSEPLIIASCPRCEAKTEPEDLTVKSYCKYLLTEKAILAAQTGHFHEPASLIDDLQNVSFEHFSFQLGWFLAMARRYQGEYFSIIAVRLNNLEDLESSLGSAGMFELMEEFVRRVRTSLRMTDFSSRGKNHDLWFILPKTDARQRETVFGRITDFIEETRQKDGIGLEMRRASLTVSSQIDEHHTQETLVSALTDQLAEGSYEVT